MSDQTIQITARNSALVDTTAVMGLERSLGTVRCREYVEETIFQITEKLAKLEGALGREDLKSAHDYTVSLIGLSARIGLIRMGMVASDLIEVLGQEDLTAAHAVGSRLIRLGEESLFSLVRLGGDGV